MAEKTIALDLVQGFVVALKHHLRGEIGIYYEDLYPLLWTLQTAPQPIVDEGDAPPETLDPAQSTHGPRSSSSSSVDVLNAERNASAPHLPSPNAVPILSLCGNFHREPQIRSTVEQEASRLLCGYAQKNRRPTTTRSVSTSPTSDADERTLLLPSRRNPAAAHPGIKTELIPFATTAKAVYRWTRRPKNACDRDQNQEPRCDFQHTHIHIPSIHDGRPAIAGNGSNIPLEILRSLSDWIALLESRGAAASAVGSLMTCLQAFESSLSTLGQVLNTPLPFAYAAHIGKDSPRPPTYAYRATLHRTLQIYLLSLPFQLAQAFRWYTIPGVAVAVYIYLGFVAAGEEMEQPFGYDGNDIDLDFFCQALVRAEIEQLKRTSGRNAVMADRSGQGTGHEEGR